MLRSCFLLLALCYVPSTFAQTAPNTYTYLIYHKLAPGKTLADALPVEREWRTINQAAVEEGQMIGWHMMVRQPNGQPAEYDYVTCIVSPVKAIKGASPAAMTRIYGDSVQVRVANLQQRDRATAPVVKFEIWENLSVALAPGFRPDTSAVVVLDYLMLRDPKADVASAVAKSGPRLLRKQKLTGWAVSTLTNPNGKENYSFAQVRVAKTKSASGRLPQPLAPLFDVVRREEFRFQQFTLKP